MRLTSARVVLENLERRSMLTASVGFFGPQVQVVNDKVGTVDVSAMLQNNNDISLPTQTVTLTTSGGTAVPGVDYTPVQQTISLTPNTTTLMPTQSVSIPILPGPASLGTRTLEISISPTPGAPQGQKEFIVITHGTDTTTPYVVNSQALIQNDKVVAFAIQFSRPMAYSTVTDLSNYAVGVVSSLSQAALAATTGTSGFSKTVPLKSALYDASNSTVYLVPAGKVKPSSHYWVESPDALQIGLQILQTKPADQLAFPATMSKLTDTVGNPIAQSAEGNEGFMSTDGEFGLPFRNAKASPSALAFLFGTTTSATPKGKAKPAHRGK